MNRVEATNDECLFANQLSQTSDPWEATALSMPSPHAVCRTVRSYASHLLCRNAGSRPRFLSPSQQNSKKCRGSFDSIGPDWTGLDTEGKRSSPTAWVVDKSQHECNNGLSTPLWKGSSPVGTRVQPPWLCDKVCTQWMEIVCHVDIGRHLKRIQP